MNIAEFSIQKSVITWTLTLVILFLGFLAFQDLSRLEDPEFVIKEAVVATPYPGASPQEVEKEVTEKIEKAVQEMGQLERVESYSSRGMSGVKVVMKDRYDRAALPQIWDELRRKINDTQAELPKGAGPSIVNDDFGDVYGVYYALTGEGFSFAELKKVAELLKRELLTVTNVKKIVFFGEQTEAVYVEMAREKMAALGITREEIFNALSAKNIPVDAGKIRIGSEFLSVVPTGTFNSEKDFNELFIGSREGRLIYLKDVATIHRGYVDPPRAILRFNGRHAIGIAISTVSGGNAVVMGDAVKARIKELMQQIPLGMELNAVAMQSDTVTKAVNGFLMNLAEAVIIVIGVLLISMGLQSGLIIGFILLLTIAGTFALMNLYDIALQRISLGALIIALGMLVDNAIVVVDGMKVRMEQGMEGLDAAKQVVGQNAIPLLGATAVTILAFAALGTMQNATGEYTGSLYYVILISLLLSWLAAVTTTPLMTKQFILGPRLRRGNKNGKQVSADPAGVKPPYGGRIYSAYRRLLKGAIRFRWITITLVAVLFLTAVYGFRYVDSMFFPASTRPQFYIECQFREGTHIRETEKGVARIEEYLKTIDGVTDIASAVGAAHSRFMLVYNVPVDTGPHYCSVVVGVTDYPVIENILPRIQNGLEQMLPDATINVKRFNIGPGNGGKIQLRISGPNPRVLQALADKAMGVMADDPEIKALRTEWGAPVKVVQPRIAEDRARRLGIDRPMVARAIQANFSGTPVGTYREGIDLIPIIARAPDGERGTMENMRDIQIYSPTAGRSIPLAQVVDGFTTEAENARISRRRRRSMITIHCDARTELPSVLFARIKPKLEQALDADFAAYLGREIDPRAITDATIPVVYDDMIPLKGVPGYFMAWGGDAEDSADAQTQLGKGIPLFFGFMVLVVICLFNAYRQPLIIWLTVPLATIGVTTGLLLFHQPFGFMAMLGFMSLSGMLIKNAIVLIDQIDLEIKTGKPPFQAVVDSGVVRMRPVLLASLTTMMGMLPLFTDAFYASMAVTIAFGLGFATVLTLVVVPTLYAAFFKIKYEPRQL